jgi:hypothetical protein
MTVRIHIPQDEIAEFCRRWQIVGLALFGTLLPKALGLTRGVEGLLGGGYGDAELRPMLEEKAMRVLRAALG